VYAFTAFGQPDDPTFLPLSNAYVPIDLSDQASTHATLAHAASHIAYLHGKPSSVSALSHKSAAIKLVNESLNDPEVAVSDGVLAAVLRLLTFEVKSQPLQLKFHITTLQNSRFVCFSVRS
jgi:Fungal specific transcription factor domain